MSVEGDIVAAAVGGATPTGAVTAVAKTVDDIWRSLFPSPEARASAAALQLKAQLDSYVARAQIDQVPLNAQIEVDKIEAASGSMFVAGGRPAIIWVCAIALALYYWPMCILGAAMWAIASWHAGSLLPHPDLGISDLLGLLGPMLGLSAMRTAEKFQGVARSNLK